MDYFDLTPVMVAGEARVMLPGKILVQLVNASLPVPFVKAPDFAIVALGEDRMAVNDHAVHSRTTWGTDHSYCKLITDYTDGPLWYGCLFEINTFNVPDEVTGFAFIVDGLGKGVGPEDLVLLVEDGVSHSHNSVFHGPVDSQSAILALLYRHKGDWKLRSQSLCFTDGTAAICAQFGLVNIWPTKSGSQNVRKQARKKATSLVSAPSPGVPVGITASVDFKPIDLDRLSSLERDTAAVSALLNDVFGDSVQDSPAASTTTGDVLASSVASSPLGLSQSYWNLIQYLMASERVAHEAFNDKAKELGELPSGALSSINDWAFDLFGDVVIIDEGDEFSLNEDLRRAVESLV